MVKRLGRKKVESYLMLVTTPEPYGCSESALKDRSYRQAVGTTKYLHYVVSSGVVAEPLLNEIDYSEFDELFPEGSGIQSIKLERRKVLICLTEKHAIFVLLSV
jgi:hypothetical protein